MIERFIIADCLFLKWNPIGDKCKPPQSLQDLWPAWHVLSNVVSAYVLWFFLSVFFDNWKPSKCISCALCCLMLELNCHRCRKPRNRCQWKFMWFHYKITSFSVAPNWKFYRLCCYEQSVYVLFMKMALEGRSHSAIFFKFRFSSEGC